VIDRIERQLTTGVEVILKDGSSVRQEVPSMALASILRELRPIVQEPVRAAEAKDASSVRPLININLGNPDEIRDAVHALRDRRERRALAAAPVTVTMPPLAAEE
jgi:hypothetical protein